MLNALVFETVFPNEISPGGQGTATWTCTLDVGVLACNSINNHDYAATTQLSRLASRPAPRALFRPMQGGVRMPPQRSDRGPYAMMLIAVNGRDLFTPLVNLRRHSLSVTAWLGFRIYIYIIF